MTELKRMLSNNEFSLIVSLPSNDIEIARAAVSAGADAIKVHVNVEHRASGNHYGSVKENQAFLEALVHEFNCPVGIVPGGTINDITPEEVKILEDLGINYFSVYIKECPTFLLNSSMEKTIAGDMDYIARQGKYLADLGIEAFEASIINGAEYGSPLSVNDLLAYSELVENTELPVIIPSQRKIKPEEAVYLKKIGVKALMIGAVCTGSTVESVSNSVKQFREALDSM